MGAANFDFPVADFDAADQVPHIALAQGRVFIAQPGAGDSGKPGNVALRQQMARHFAMLFQRRDHAQSLFPVAFDLRQGLAEHIRIPDRAIREGGVEAFDPPLDLTQLLAQVLGL
jgi:hypothetical protein